jgi:hypothetical protein
MSHFIYCFAECRYAECRYAECRGDSRKVKNAMELSLIIEGTTENVIYSGI